ncbi:MAG: rod shape-determining protein MreC [Elusimicrobia bacterium]|nr:rod shape-determining protein MreC [Elusimicrobiota bacterium]
MRWESFKRRRATVVLVILLLLSLGLLTLHRTPYIQTFRTLLWRAEEPTPRSLARLPVVSSHAKGTVSSDKTQQLERRLERDRLQAVLAENDRLRQLIGFRASQWPTAKAAQVIGRDPQYWFRSLLIDRGTVDDLSQDAPVVAVEGPQAGLIGRVQEVAPHTAKVLLITDPLSAVIGVCRRVGDEGVVVGTSSGELKWQYLVPETTVHLGDLVETSGGSDLFPPGLPLGWITEISPQETVSGFRAARLKPAVIPSRTREVLVLLQ